MIICILGYTSSGKDTIAKILSKKTGMPIIKQHTTRPIRKNEVQDREYHFTNNDFFDNELENMIAIQEYKVWDGSIWKYGIHKSKINMQENSIIILEPNSYEELVNEFPNDKIIPFFINVDTDIILRRIEKRGDNMKEAERRLEDDIKKFKRFFLQHDEYIFISNNENNPDTPASLIETILLTWYL